MMDILIPYPEMLDILIPYPEMMDILIHYQEMLGILTPYPELLDIWIPLPVNVGHFDPLIENACILIPFDMTTLDAELPIPYTLLLSDSFGAVLDKLSTDKKGL